MYYIIIENTRFQWMRRANHSIELGSIAEIKISVCVCVTKWNWIDIIRLEMNIKLNVIRTVRWILLSHFTPFIDGYCCQWQSSSICTYMHYTLHITYHTAKQIRENKNLSLPFFFVCVCVLDVIRTGPFTLKNFVIVTKLMACITSCMYMITYLC